MNRDEAGSADIVARDTARFDYIPEAAHYDRALWRFTLGTWPGRTGSLLLPAAFGAAAFFVRVLVWHLDEIQIIAAGACCVIALFAVRQRFRKHRVRQQYEGWAAYGSCHTLLTEDGLTTTGDDGKSDRADWHAYPWWFETSELFVLTGSLGYFLVLPKHGAASPEDLVRTRALFSQHLRRI
ncbi:YcxB family protein [Streptomyces sp. NPDC021080]|uniref:YcxB family protein n=1 Tax=Streptomyces sp. NPDC021080 TaxID=3365110 RepID=UPI0037943945